MVTIGSIPAAWIAAAAVSAAVLVGASALDERPHPQDVRQKLELIKERQFHPLAAAPSYPGVPEYSLRYRDDPPAREDRGQPMF